MSPFALLPRHTRQRDRCGSTGVCLEYGKGLVWVAGVVWVELASRAVDLL